MNIYSFGPMDRDLLKPGRAKDSIINLRRALFDEMAVSACAPSDCFPQTDGNESYRRTGT
jgi:hypothetical protein